MNRSVIALLLVGLALFLCPSPSFSGCGWIDGMDQAGKDDPGRGLLNWHIHYDHVKFGRAPSDVHRIVGTRIATLTECLPRFEFARLYADVSVLIAKAGRSHAGWKDQMDSAAPSDDPGRGISNWQLHYDHVAQHQETTPVSRLVNARMKALSTELPRDIYARLYADVSVLIAKYGVKGI